MSAGGSGGANHTTRPRQLSISAALVCPRLEYCRVAGGFLLRTAGGGWYWYDESAIIVTQDRHGVGLFQDFIS